MAAAANYAWVNRSSMTFLTRQVSRVYAARTRACVGECGVVEMRKGPLQFRCQQPRLLNRTGAALLVVVSAGIRQDLQLHARRLGHARDLRRVAQHCQGV